MGIKISHQDLQILCKYISDDHLTEQLYDYLKDKRGDCHFYGYKSYDAKYLEIIIPQLEKILAELSRVNRKHQALHKIINKVYQAGITTKQTSVFLYRRYSK